MKIQAKQLDERTREGVATAVQLYAGSLNLCEQEARKKYSELSTAIRHGELVLCKLEYNEGEEKLWN